MIFVVVVAVVKLTSSLLALLRAGPTSGIQIVESGPQHTTLHYYYE
jgi:hypothetical protein